MKNLPDKNDINELYRQLTLAMEASKKSLSVLARVVLKIVQSDPNPQDRLYKLLSRSTVKTLIDIATNVLDERLALADSPIASILKRCSILDQQKYLANPSIEVAVEKDGKLITETVSIFSLTMPMLGYVFGDAGHGRKRILTPEEQIEGLKTKRFLGAFRPDTLPIGVRIEADGVHIGNVVLSKTILRQILAIYKGRGGK